MVFGLICFNLQMLLSLFMMLCSLHLSQHQSESLVSLENCGLYLVHTNMVYPSKSWPSPMSSDYVDRDMCFKPDSVL